MHIQIFLMHQTAVTIDTFLLRFEDSKMHSLKRFDGSDNIDLGREWSAMPLKCSNDSNDSNKISKE